MRWAVGCSISSVSKRPRKQERSPDIVGNIKLEQNVRLVHLSITGMDTTKLCDIVLGVPIHGCVRILEELVARMTVRREETILRGPGQPLARLLLHHDPISIRRVVCMGIQFTDLQ